MGNLVAPLNWYDLIRHVYPKNGVAVTDEARMSSVMIGGEQKFFREGLKMSEYSRYKADLYDIFKGGLKIPQADIFLNKDLSTRVNQAEMRKTLHIPDSIQAYEQCSSNSKFQYQYQQEGSMWIYQVLKDTDIRMMFYSGDTDAMVPFSGTRKWIKELKMTVKEKWSPWMTNNQISGYKVRYDGLDFVTVKGVGHMAPQWARQDV